MTTSASYSTGNGAANSGDQGSATSTALERYQYVLRTSSPGQIEQAHAQVFAAMSEAERREVLRALATTSEPAADASASSLARAATRYEMQQPGGLQNLLGRTAGGAADFSGPVEVRVVVPAGSEKRRADASDAAVNAGMTTVARCRSARRPQRRRVDPRRGSVARARSWRRISRATRACARSRGSS